MFLAHPDLLQYTTMKLALVSALLGSAAAFAPAPSGRAFAPAPSGRASTAVRDSLNGWVPDESKFAWGLPGSLPPVGEFDPAGFAKVSWMQRLALSGM